MPPLAMDGHDGSRPTRLLAEGRTTVTDMAGFFSFLGIATLLASTPQGSRRAGRAV